METDHGGRTPGPNAFRPKGAIRRYAVVNDLDTTITLGYGDDYLGRAMSWETVGADAGRYLRRLRKVEGGGPIPWVRVVERQPGRSEAVGSPVFNGMLLVRRIPRDLFGAAVNLWDFGPSAARSAGCDIRTRRPCRGGARSAASYAAKYLSKDLGDVPVGRHRYEVGEGFAVQRSESLHRSSVGALAAASAVGLSYHWQLPDRTVWWLSEARDDLEGVAA